MPTLELFPKLLRLTKGKTNTVTAVAKNDSNVYEPAATFTAFAAANAALVGTSMVHTTEDFADLAATPPPNLRTVTGLLPGTTTMTATYLGVTSAPITVTVDDPAATPQAVIKADDGTGAVITTLNTKVGEAIELNGDSSVGVAKCEWNWGDGDTTTENLSATHAYLTAGSKTVTLKITNSLGFTNTATVIVNVSALSPATVTYNVTSLADLLAKFNLCTGGEHIVIAAGAILTGDLILPAKNFTDYVTIRSSGVMPDLRDRISPTSNQVATIKGGNAGVTPVTIKNSSKLVRFVGIKFDSFVIDQEAGIGCYYGLKIGETIPDGPGQTSKAQNPQRIILEHCVINPPDNVRLVHGVLNDGWKVSMIGCSLVNMKSYGSQDCQAVISFDGRGAHVYNNCHLQASSENIMYGGSRPNIPNLVSENMEFRRCLFNKKPSWRAGPNSTSFEQILNVKNLFEFKNGRRCYVEGCILTDSWQAQQAAALVLKTSVASSGLDDFTPYAVTEDIVFENCIVARVYALLAGGNDAVFVPSYRGRKPNGIKLKNVLGDDVSNRYAYDVSSPGNSRIFQPNSQEDVLIDHVTIINKDVTSGMGIYFEHGNCLRFAVTNSIFPMNVNYGGIAARGVAEGFKALNAGSGGTGSASSTLTSRDSTASWTFKRNVVVRNGVDTSTRYPAAEPDLNFYPAAIEAVGFANLAGGDYSLAANSLYKNQATDGTDPGINRTVLNQRTATTLAGIGSGTVITDPGSTASIKNVVAAPLSSSRVSIDFDASTDTFTVAGYRIGRAENINFSTGYVETDTASAAKPVILNDLVAGRTYYYRVKAFNAGKTSFSPEWSAPAAATQPAVSGSSGRKIVTWSGGVVEDNL